MDAAAGAVWPWSRALLQCLLSAPCSGSLASMAGSCHVPGPGAGDPQKALSKAEGA